MRDSKIAFTGCWSADKKMVRINRICAHPRWNESVKKIHALERDRIFYKHDIAHFLDVARIAYIEDLENGLGIPNKRYTPEFKQQVVESVLQDGPSYKEAARLYDVQGYDRIQNRERIYLEEGPEGLALERRGRRSPGRPKKLPSKVEEDLLAEVQRLRAENAYLKNLQALVLEEERRQRKKRR